MTLRTPTAASSAMPGFQSLGPETAFSTRAWNRRPTTAASAATIRLAAVAQPLGAPPARRRCAACSKRRLCGTWSSRGRISTRAANRRSSRSSISTLKVAKRFLWFASTLGPDRRRACGDAGVHESVHGRSRALRTAPFDHPALCVSTGHVGDDKDVKPQSPGARVADDRWVLIPAVGARGNSVPLQTFEELLPGIGTDGSRAHAMTETCPSLK